MILLPEEHPDINQYMSEVGFTVQISKFGRIPADQTVVNKVTQTAGRTKGFSLKPMTVKKFYIKDMRLFN